MTKQITMNDIVKELGHSRRTVSSVLNGKAAERGISAKTAEKILAYVEKRGYVQSRSALMLRGISQKSIGVLYVGPLYTTKIQAYNDFVHYYRGMYPETHLEIFVDVSGNIFDGIRELMSRGIEKLVCFYGFPNKNIDYNPFLIQAKQLEKVVIFDYEFINDNDPWEKKFLDAGISLIGISRDTGALLVAEALLKHGHQNVILPANYKNTRHPVFLEKSGLKCHFCEVGIPFQIGRLFSLDDLAVSVKKMVEKNIAKALYFHNDPMAAMAIMAFLKLGMKVPEDISVIGFANQLVSMCNIIPITTIDFPIEGMLHKMYDVLADGKELRHEFVPELILRKSLGKFKY